MAASVELALNRDLMHAQFSSWRLQRFAAIERHQLTAVGHAAGIASTSLDFLHTRASVTRNHLAESEGRLFVFTQQEGAPGHHVFELLPSPSSDAGLLPRQVAELDPGAGEEAEGGAVEAVLDCSLAVVAAADGAGGSGAAPAPATPGTEAAAAARPVGESGYSQLLVSRGHGDVVLVRQRGEGTVCSNAVHPVRPRLPMAGVRPVVLEAATEQPNGDITAVAWAIRSRHENTAACCEVFAVTLRPSEQEGSGGGRLRLSTVGVQLLQRSKLPPYLVRVYASPAASGGGALAVVGFDPNNVGLEEEDEEPDAPEAHTHHHHQPGGAAAAAAADAMDDGGDDMDPRTLEQAAARLEHMTGEERAGPQPHAQWADIYKESGPDGVGAMGGEPVVDLAAWRLGGQAGGSTDKAVRPYWRLSCHAHRLLTADGPLQPRSPQPLLLGLTDDVDCAVVRLDVGGEPELKAHHAVSIPALAYVAAGKTYKRHLLLGSAGTGGSSSSSSSGTGASGSSSNAASGSSSGSISSTPLSAVLVESQRFMYLYGATSTREEYGRQQVVELGLEQGETVLGARLVELGEPEGLEEGKQVGGMGGGAVVAVVTQQRLLSYRLNWL